VGGPYQIHVIPLLVEKNLGAHVDRILVVDCDEALQLNRLLQRDGCTEADARAILAAQASRTARQRAAHDLILNEGDMSLLAPQVEALHNRYLELAR
jgi:dephospho-CoA kinase